jgi:hypothetical protein
MVTIKVKLPDGVTPDEIEALARFSNTIDEKWVEYFFLTSSPRWERDTSVKHTIYFRLMTGEDKPREVVSEKIATLRSMTPDEFRERLYVASWSSLFRESRKTT